MSETPHSAAVLTDLRDSWWHTDFLQLVIARLGLERRGHVADIGCGQGHWGQRLLPLLPASTRLTGIDREPRWRERATARADALGLSAQCTYAVGSSNQLPLEDDAFDLVTCQTLLMHLPDPAGAIAEMLRVLKPGGQLLLCEPNNVAQQFTEDTVNQALSPTQLGELMTLFVACSRGRSRLGRGDDCIGDKLPLMLQELDFEAITVFQNDRVNAVAPPYDEGDRAQLQEALDHARKGFWLWDREDARALYQAGGGSPISFDAHYEVFSERTRLFERQVHDGTYACTSGSLHYLIAARSPAAPG